MTIKKTPLRSRGADIVSSHCLIFSPVGGSHYLLLDEISQNLHQHGHEVRMLLQLGNPVITGTYILECILFSASHSCIL